ncbi:hypothetical protein BJY01DRAFT_248020 [Aspergillus pseudoustus]|uniref:Uncharacterized protein n=1 Tax=Aspergillus pseudoustus TaxID=1810923 RepID=A0ABR4JYV4_9EURO
MSLLHLLALTLTTALLTRAQIGYNAKTNKFLCPAPATQYCAAASLLGSSIISCTAQGSAQIKNCFVEFSHLLPAGCERAAVCYESSPKSGNAVCAFNGTGYTFAGSEIDVPGTVLCLGITPEFDLSGTEQEIALEGGDLIKKRKSGLYGHVEVLDSSLRASSHVSMVSPTSFTEPVSLPSAPETGNEIDRPVCSNPWAMGRDQGRELFTLDVVLVVPTRGSTTTTSTPAGWTTASSLSVIFTSQVALTSPMAAGSVVTDSSEVVTSVLATSTTSTKASTTRTEASSTLSGSGAIETKASSGARCLSIECGLKWSAWFFMVLLDVTLRYT